MWQSHHYGVIALIMGFGIPAMIPWLFWDDLAGGLIYTCVIRMFVVHQVLFLRSIWVGKIISVRFRAFSASTRLLIGVGTLLLTTNILPVITLSLQSLPSERAFIIFTTNSPWTTAMASSGIIMIQPNG
jgi:hypothetical protein